MEEHHVELEPEGSHSSHEDVGEDKREIDIEKQLLSTGMPWYRNSNQRVLVAMGTLTLLFCVAEFLFGIVANSLALMSDAFHMLSDLISLVVGFIAIQLSHRSASKSKSYGWIRAEVLGGLINGVFLIAVCFFIVLEAIQRFMEPPGDDNYNATTVIIVGCAGLGMNIIGLVLFSSHASMGGHGHSHGHSHSHGHGHGHKEEKHKEPEGADHKHEHKKGNANLHAIFLHVLGDALGSVGAIASGVIIKFAHGSAKYYADPILSIFLAMIILKGSVPLVKHCTNILLQAVPENVELEKIYDTLMKIEGIVNVHDLHVWQLSDTKHIATLHITVYDNADFSSIAARIKNLFHQQGVHNTTIQPEYVPAAHNSKGKIECKMACEEPDCREKMCCERTPRAMHTEM